jgi:hypothetical protein
MRKRASICSCSSGSTHVRISFAHVFFKVIPVIREETGRSA